MRQVVVLTAAVLLILGSTSDENQGRAANLSQVSSLMHRGTHDAGNLYMSISNGDFGYKYHLFVNYYDQETGDSLGLGVLYPHGGTGMYLFYGDLWIGAVVNDDTLVSQGEIWAQWGIYASRFKEFWPENPDIGGLYRTGRYADDEFVTVFTDTITEDTLVGKRRYLEDTCHIPIGLRVTQTSYSWSDSVYSDFIIVDYRIENIRGDYIRDGWIGIYIDAMVMDTIGYYIWDNYRDDLSGLLDTVLDDSDPDRRVLIPYSFDNDGDPIDNSAWGAISSRGVISIQLLDTNIDGPTQNFNWWISGDYYTDEYGPRRLGTEADPFREFAGGLVGEPRIDRDRYYVMSHPEVDFDQLESAIHDSTDGWLPYETPQTGYDTKYLYSLGPFDLSPGDTITFTLTLVVSENFHVNPDDFINYCDLGDPFEYHSRLDFSDLMTNHRRADSVYRSGFTLPRPGPPIGLKVVDYDDYYVSLAWHPSSHPAAAGYFLNVKDSEYDDQWHHALPCPTSDTIYTLTVFNPTHPHLFAMSTVDTTGWESALSASVEVIPARPHPPCSLSAILDSMTAVLNWQPSDDEGLAAYIIYRAIWNGPFAVYDSTMQTWYRDENSESGVRYTYRITARHECGAESEPTDSVSILPMALDKGILFYDLNSDNAQYVGPYHKRYVDRLFYSLQPAASPDYYDIEAGLLSFKDMADYTVIIFDSEKRGGRFPPEVVDSIANYLKYGGRALFIIPNATCNSVGALRPSTARFSEGNFFHDVLRLDSAVVNSIVLKDNAIWGDLTGCRPTAGNFPVLEADLAKLEAALIDINGYIPYAGFLYPHDDVDILYRYQSLYPDSIFHEQINGIAFADENYRFVLFSFPLSLMSETSNIMALREAMEFLGVYMDCGDISNDNRLDIGDAVFLIGYLYRAGPPPADMKRADVDCNGGVDLGDAVAIINLIFRDSPGLSCCK